MAHCRLRTGGVLATALTIISIGVPSALAADSNPFEAGEPVGDGYTVIPTATRIFNVNHHASLRIECRELDTGATCAGYPFLFPTKPVTGWAPHGVIDAQTGNLWVSAQVPTAPNDIGFACIKVGQDSTTPPADCGWVKTGTGSLVLNFETWGGSINSGNSVGRKIYAIDSNAKVHCVDMAAGAACAGQPYDVGLPLSDGNGTQLTRIGDTSKFIARSNPPTPNMLLGITPGPSKVMCFDAATDAACAGWAAPKSMGTSDLILGKTINGSVISAQIGSDWDAFCGILAQNYPGANTSTSSLDVSCLKLSDGTSAPVPAGMGGTSLTSGRTGWQFGWAGVGEADTSGTRVYFTLTRFLGPANLDPMDRLVCYDYATDAVCAGYPSDFFGGSPAETASKTYATSVDASGTCVWTLGDPGVPVHRRADAPDERCYPWVGLPKPPPTTTTTKTAPTQTPSNDARATILASVGCGENKLLLTDVFPRAGKTRLLGVAPSAAAGKQVTIRSAWNGRTVATPTVGQDLTFSATVRLPPKRIRLTNKARYVATFGSERSLVLKFARRMYTTSITQKGDMITFTGRVTKPHAKPMRRVVLRASASCSTIRKGSIVAKVMPSKTGVFKARFRRPAGLTTVYMRAQTQVRRYANRKTTSDTFTLIRGVKLPG